MTDRSAIGFDRTIRLEWMDVVATRVGEGLSDAEIRAYLWDYFGQKGEVAGGDAATRKTITVLRHIWSFVPEDCREMRDNAMHLLANCTTQERVAVHWAITTATYPFFADVATAVGRLLRLQATVTSQQVYRRLKENWGDRSTVRRAGQHALSTMHTWGILSEAGKQGEFVPRTERIVMGDPVAVLIFEGLIRFNGGGAIPINELQRHPSLFAFETATSAARLRRCSQFQISRQGIDTDFVELRKI